jgi:hypothetical protein
MMNKYIIILFLFLNFLLSNHVFAEVPKIDKEIESSVKKEVDNTLNKINEVIPEETKTSVLNIFSQIEVFRTEKLVEIDATKSKTENDIKIIKDGKGNIDKNKVENDPLKEPLSYIKLVLFTILSFLFSNSVIFYIVLVLVIFYILRFIYRKIRNR